jgi:hypothetical protein
MSHDETRAYQDFCRLVFGHLQSDEGDRVENAELILNLWYVYDDTGLVYSLRARCYVGSGDDEEKLALLRHFAQIDYLIAQPFPVPERFHTTIVEGNTQKKVPVVHLYVRRTIWWDSSSV